MSKRQAEPFLWLLSIVAVASLALGVCAQEEKGKKGGKGKKEPKGTKETKEDKGTGKAPEAYALRISVSDKRAGAWAFSFHPHDCTVTGLRGWRFSKSDSASLEKLTAKFKTRTRKLTPAQKKDDSVPKMDDMGLDVFVVGSPDQILELKATKISVTFELRELIFGQPLQHDSSDKVQVRRIPMPIDLTPTDRECDYVSVAVDSKKQAWASWIEYGEKGDKLLLGAVTPTGIGDVYDVAERAGRFFNPITAVDERDRIWVIFGMEEKGNIDLYARNLNGFKWMKTDRLTNHPAPDINPSLYLDAKGKIWVVWQSARDGDYDIFMKHVHDATWSAEYCVTSTAENEWFPAVCANKDGIAFVAYDVYRGSDYDIAMRKFVNEKFEDAGYVAATTANETHASLLVDAKDRMWMAWEEGPGKWGREYPHGDGAAVHAPRRIRYKVIEAGEEKAAGELTANFPYDMKEGNEAPRLAADDKGRVWMAFRHLAGGLTPRRSEADSLTPLWESYVTYCSNKGWSEPMPLSRSEGRQEQRPRLWPAKDGKVWAAWAGDGRECWEQDVLPQRCTIHAGPVDAAKDAEEPVVEARQAEAPAEKLKSRRAIGYGTVIAKKEYRLLFGDLNRPTEMSVEAEAAWGTYEDLFRYAWDPGGLDFVGVTENFADSTRLLPWRRAQDFILLYSAPKRFVSVLGNWRIAPFPIGSRIVVSDSLGAAPIGIFYADPRAKKVAEDDAKKLWDAIQKDGKTRRLSIPITSASKLGTDWGCGASPVEPVVEIFNGAHWSYEQEGAPLAAEQGVKTVHEGFEAAGFVSKALSKGIKLGFVAGSGPGSLRCAFTGAYVEEATAKGLLDALLARRCYAATDRIVLDCRVEGHFMGEEFTVSEKPEFHIRVIGSDEVKDLAVIKNGKPIHTTDPDGADVAHSFTDDKVEAGKPAIYYIRVIQDNGKMAWGSPMWITMK
ncbi:MAG: hypothetical protein AB1696_05760 [Planctomycetota bacterium]